MLQHGCGNKLPDKVNAHDVGHKSYLAGAKVHKESWVCSGSAYSGGRDLLTYFIKYIEQAGSTGSNIWMQEASWGSFRRNMIKIAESV